MSQAEQTQGTTGRLLAGRYRLGDVLGRGGMGTVWRAVDEMLGRTVAVKELRFPSSVDEDEKRRLVTRTLREAKAIARIRSRGAVTVYDVVDEDDRPWIVMELIEGASLADVIREEGTLTPLRAAEVGLEVLDVLRAAHGQGILHRDVKPSNVLISDDGRVVLTDFGIAQVEGDPSVTSTGMLVGAPSYISPERARGQKPGPPADLWSLGGLLYACVEGSAPYDKGSALATLTAVMTDPVEPPRNAGPLGDVIDGLLIKDPGKRLDEAGARVMLQRALETAKAEPVPVAPEPTRTMTLPTPPPEDAPEEAVPVAADAPQEKADSGRNGAAAAASGAAADRVRSALRSVRNASASDRAAADAPTPVTPAVSRTTPFAGRVSPRVLAVVAIVVLALLGSALVYTFAGDDGTGGGEKLPAASSGSDGSGGGEDKGRDKDTGAGNSASPSASPSASAEDEKDDDSSGKGSSDELPDGYRKMADPGFHFAMAMPEGWKRTGTAGQNSGGIYSRSGGYPRIQVDFNSSPGTDAKAAWESAEPGTASSSQDYRLIGIEKVGYRGYPTVADWEFERSKDGRMMRVLNRGFRVNSTHGYAIMISCPKDAWNEDECRTLRETAFRTFRVKD